MVRDFIPYNVKASLFARKVVKSRIQRPAAILSVQSFSCPDNRSTALTARCHTHASHPAHRRPPIGLFVCAFHASARYQAPPLIGLAAFLKSSSALSLLSHVSRISLSLLPISLRLQWRRGSTLFKFLSIILIGAPLLFATSIAILSVERTPISGRWRSWPFSLSEEEAIRNEFVDSKNPNAYQWLWMLKSMLGDKSDNLDFFGARILPPTDWRVLWARAVLDHLVSNLDSLQQTDSKTQSAPPLKYPYQARTAETDDKVRLASSQIPIFVIDDPATNAMSFGFSPDGSKQPGVVILFRGYIDEILGTDTTKLANSVAPTPKSLWLSSSSQPPVLPVTPTAKQSEELAIILSHELSHLLLSHSLENICLLTYCQHFKKFGADVLRTITYPITAILGPFVNDAIGQVFNEYLNTNHHRTSSISAPPQPKGSESDCFAYAKALHVSCHSIGQEKEADLVSLRLLDNSGWNPKAALAFWQHKVATSESQGKYSVKLSEGMQGLHQMHMLHPNKGTGIVDTIGNKPLLKEDNTLVVQDGKKHKPLRTHPFDHERVEYIREELEKWDRLKKHRESKV